MAEVFARLSKDSRRLRFFSLTQPSAKLIETFCDDADPRKQLCLIVMRASGGASRIIASANYMARDEATAEIALAVDAAFHGKGVGSLLLERLAVRNGFHPFWAVTMPDNQRMLDVFRQSGFECHSRANDGCGFPVALKLASSTIVHKTEFGAVHLGLVDEAAVKRAFGEIQRSLERAGRLHEMDGVLLQPMISEGVELMVGVTQDLSLARCSVSV
jgi:GNAT superfamily N-acetyltransferase